jgi:chromosome segregation ATPase
MSRVGWARRRPPALCPHGVLPDACVECLRALVARLREDVESERERVEALRVWRAGAEAERDIWKAKLDDCRAALDLATKASVAGVREIQRHATMLDDTQRRLDAALDAARAEAAALREALDTLQIAFADAESAARRINIGCACGDCIRAYDELRAALEAAKAKP